jgi:hypothetical protein
MLVGIKERFAIEAKPEVFSCGWILGRLRFWLGGHPVGDWDDTADLKGCVRWLRDFADKPRDRQNDVLIELDRIAAFHAVYDATFGTNAAANPAEQTIPHAYGRFHISYLGMSSMERFDILLIKDRAGNERCIWRESGVPTIYEQCLDPREMESVALEFCNEFEDAHMNRPPSEQV